MRSLIRCGKAYRQIEGNAYIQRFYIRDNLKASSSGAQERKGFDEDGVLHQKISKHPGSSWTCKSKLRSPSNSGLFEISRADCTILERAVQKGRTRMTQIACRRPPADSSADARRLCFSAIPANQQLVLLDLIPFHLVFARADPRMTSLSPLSRLAPER